MFKVFGFLSKRDDLDRDAFIDYYENKHVPFVLDLAPGPAVYKRHYVLPGVETGGREEGTLEFDVMTEVGFPDREAFNAWIAKVSTDAVAADEANFLDRSRIRMCICEERVSAE